MPAITRNPRIHLAIAVLFLLVFPFLAGQAGYYMGLVVTACMYSIAAIALNLLTGYGGQVSVGNSGFLMIGGYTVAILGSRLGVPIWLAVPAAGVVTGVIGLVIGLPAIRLRGHFLAVATLGFGLCVPTVAMNWKSLTAGYAGMSVMRPDLVSSDLAFYYVFIAVTLFIVWVTVNIAKSRMGRAFVAVRDSEVAAAATGINVPLYKTIMFTISAFLTGVAGGLYVYWIGFISPNDFDIVTSFLLLAMIVIGGLASIWGAICGAVLLSIIPHFTSEYTGVTDLVIGIVVMAVILLRPGGLVSLTGLAKRPAPREPEQNKNQSPSSE